MSNVRGLSWASLICVMCFSTQSAGAANSYENYTPGLAEKYGIDYSGFEHAADMSSRMTETRHHRFGQQTGIGSSTMQTESATVESMPSLNYTPTAVSPAVSPGVLRQPFTRVQLFSQSMLTTPALRPSFVSSTSLFGNEMLMRGGVTDLDRLRLIPSRSEDFFHIGAPGRRSQRGRYFDLQLTNPFSGLER